MGGKGSGRRPKPKEDAYAIFNPHKARALKAIGCSGEVKKPTQMNAVEKEIFDRVSNLPWISTEDSEIVEVYVAAWRILQEAIKAAKKEPAKYKTMVSDYFKVYKEASNALGLNPKARRQMEQAVQNKEVDDFEEFIKGSVAT